MGLTLVKRSVLVLLAAVAVGCGPPGVGDKCSATGFACADNLTALECYGGVWRAVPCRGPAGCSRTGETVKCDVSGNQSGDACATTMVRTGICATDLKSSLICDPTDLAFKVASTCRTCTVEDMKVKCMQ